MRTILEQPQQIHPAQHTTQIEVLSVCDSDSESESHNPMSFGYQLDRAIDIFCKERLTKKTLSEFKETLINLKTLYGTRISKEFLKPYYKNIGEKKTKFRDRFSNICKRAELKTEIGVRYTERVTSTNGILYKEKGKELLTFFVI